MQSPQPILEQPATVSGPYLTGWIVVGTVLILSVWGATLFTPWEGWITVPMGICLANWIGQGLVGSTRYKAMVCGISFLGVCYVGLYFTLLATYALRERSHDDFPLFADLGYLIFGFPLLVDIPLLCWGIVISMNAKRERSAVQIVARKSFFSDSM